MLCGHSRNVSPTPSLEAKGGTTLTDYITGKGYLDFTANNTTLAPGVGFCVNKP